jgi:hypothetical protein
MRNEEAVESIEKLRSQVQEASGTESKISPMRIVKSRIAMSVAAGLDRSHGLKIPPRAKALAKAGMER